MQLKRIVSVSLGSASRDHSVQTEILGQKFNIERVGTNGDMDKAIALIKELDGKVAAFGLGGIDLYLYAGKKRYILKDALRIAGAAKSTPIVDGSGLKNTLERRVIKYLVSQVGLDFRGKKVLMVCGADRFGMAETFVEEGADMTFGDMVFGLGIPIPLKSLGALERLAKVLMPIISRIPFKYLYPTGSKQDSVNPRYYKLYQNADIIAGDFLYIKKYMPDSLAEKVIITNTVTPNDIEALRERGVKLLVTTTPELKGRSFGTNVMEGVLVALADKPPSELKAQDYNELLDKINFTPRIVQLSRAKVI